MDILHLQGMDYFDMDIHDHCMRKHFRLINKPAKNQTVRLFFSHSASFVFWVSLAFNS